MLGLDLDTSGVLAFEIGFTLHDIISCSFAILAVSMLMSSFEIITYLSVCFLC